MKKVKKILLSLISLISLNFVSAYAYAGSYKNFGILRFFQSTLEYIPLALAFLLIFWGLNFGINRTKIKNGWVIALILSIFSTYGLTKLNIPIENIFYKIGFNERLLFEIGPWIVLAFAMYAVWKWGFGKLLIIFGLIIFNLGFFKVAVESGAAMMLGVAGLIIGLLINKKETRRRKDRRELKNMNLSEKERYLKDRAENRERQLSKWNKAGRIVGRGIGKGIKTGANLTEKGTKLTKKQISKMNKLQRRYNKYSKRLNKIIRANNGTIPARDTKEGKEYSRLISGMRRVEKIAERNNRKLH
jgi:hypothetical protein